MTDPRPHLVFCYRYGIMGGVVSQLRNRLDAFQEHYRVSFVFRRDLGASRFLPPELVHFVHRPSDAIELLQELSPDVVDVIDSPWFLPVWRDAGRPGRLVLEVHTTTAVLSYLDDLDETDGIDRIITVSEAMRHRLAPVVEGIAPLHVVPNCLDPRWTRDGPTHVADRKPIVWVGKLDGHKRWRTAVHVLEELLADRATDDAAPLFIGGYANGAENFTNMTVRLTRSRAMRAATWWPLVPYERMPQVLRSAGASGGISFVTSRDESFGMSVAESVVAGCPVVAPRLAALAELLPDAAMYEPGDRIDAVRTVRRALDEPTLRDELLSTRSSILARTAPSTALQHFIDAVD